MRLQSWRMGAPLCKPLLTPGLLPLLELPFALRPPSTRAPPVLRPPPRLLFATLPPSRRAPPLVREVTWRCCQVLRTRLLPLRACMLQACCRPTKRYEDWGRRRLRLARRCALRRRRQRVGRWLLLRRLASCLGRRLARRALRLRRLTCRSYSQRRAAAREAAGSLRSVLRARPKVSQGLSRQLEIGSPRPAKGEPGKLHSSHFDAQNSA